MKWPEKFGNCGTEDEGEKTQEVNEVEAGDFENRKRKGITGPHFCGQKEERGKYSSSERRREAWRENLKKIDSVSIFPHVEGEKSETIQERGRHL